MFIVWVFGDHQVPVCLCIAVDEMFTLSVYMYILVHIHMGKPKSWHLNILQIETLEVHSF